MATTPEQPPLERASGGDAQAGYEVWSEPARRLLRMRVWGAWALPLALEYEQCLKHHMARFVGAPYAVVSDIRDSRIQPLDVAEVRSRCVRMGVESGQVRCAWVVTATLTRMQMRRIASGAGVPEAEFFTEEEPAVAWALELK